ncbi:hypothetical protein [Xylanibacter rodentium]|uniref:hypothetical protein n=1 Tax=Xylanibacter rodentium TaxID=2736289 RepID=UPI00259029B6|nr:hypothetical protein [Xylanibacter rodentium]
MTKRLAIVGSRDCPPIDITLYLPFVPSTIVSGGAKGADTYAKEYAVKNDIPIIEYLPKYDRYGRKAPLMRNIEIVENCDYLLAFWNGTSRGTKFTIDYASKRGVPYKVVVTD